MRQVAKFKSGKEVVFTKGFKYKTAIPEELDYFSRTNGFVLEDPDMKVIKKYLDELPEIPTLDVKISKEEAQQYLWFDKDEEYVIEELLKRGFITKKESAKPEYILKARREARWKGIADKEILAEVKARKLDIKEKTKDVEELSAEAMVLKLKQDGYTVYKPKKK